jgi:hypothetical protein
MMRMESMIMVRKKKRKTQKKIKRRLKRRLQIVMTRIEGREYFE